MEYAISPYLHLYIFSHVGYQRDGVIRAGHRTRDTIDDWVYIIRFSIPGAGTYWTDVMGICH